jgi:drug/metabolite transporter (DMT)-like permease
VTAARLAPWAAALCGVQVGASIVATRFVIDQLGPASIAFVRYAIALAALLPFVPLSRAAIARADIVPILLLGVAQFGLLIALLNVGLQTIAAAPAALIFASFPLLTLLLAAALGHERLSATKLAGVALTLAGVALALGPAAFDAGAARWVALAVLASAFTGAACSVLLKPYLERYPALPVSVWSMAAAVAVLAAWAAFERLDDRLSGLDAAAWGALVFIGLSSAGGYFLWLWALRHCHASRVTLFLALSPLTALLLGAWWLGEPLHTRLVLALALVAAGLAVAPRQPNRTA